MEGATPRAWEGRRKQQQEDEAHWRHTEAEMPRVMRGQRSRRPVETGSGRGLETGGHQRVDGDERRWAAGRAGPSGTGRAQALKEGALRGLRGVVGGEEQGESIGTEAKRSVRSGPTA